MASRRKRKRPLPDWVGVLYDDKSKDEDEPGGSEHQDSAQTQVPGSSSKPEDTATADNCLSKKNCSSQSTDNDKTKANVQYHSKRAEKAEPLSAEEIIRLSLPLLKFEGSLIYSHNSSDSSLLCDEILTSLQTDGEMHVGFDMEWPVSFSSGGDGKNKTALIQLCTAANKVYLFHISAMGCVPKLLKTLICHERLIKYGINIESDFWKLERDFDIRVRNVIKVSVCDLTPIANAKMKSTERWTLDGLTRNVLRKRLNKEGGVRCGRWDTFPLSEEQIEYAAADAYACYLLAHHFLKK